MPGQLSDWQQRIMDDFRSECLELIASIEASINPGQLYLAPYELGTTAFYIEMLAEDLRRHIHEHGIDGVNALIRSWRGAYELEIDQVRRDNAAKFRIMDVVGTIGATIEDVDNALHREGIEPRLGRLLIEDTQIASKIAARKNRANATTGTRNQAIADIIESLARQEGTAKELWPEFMRKLANAGMRPDEAGSGIEYTLPDGRLKTMSFGTFANRISTERK